MPIEPEVKLRLLMANVLLMALNWRAELTVMGGLVSRGGAVDEGRRVPAAVRGAVGRGRVSLPCTVIPPETLLLMTLYRSGGRG